MSMANGSVSSIKHMVFNMAVVVPSAGQKYINMVHLLLVISMKPAFLTDSYEVLIT